MTISEQTSVGTEESVRPLVASAPSYRSLWYFGAALLIGGFFLFRTLDNHRNAITAPSITVPPDTAAGYIASPPDLEIPTPRDEQAYFAPGWPTQNPRTVEAPRSAALPIRQQGGGSTSAARTPATYQLPPLPEPPAPPPYSANRSNNLPDRTNQDALEPPVLEGSSSSEQGKERVEAARFANAATTVPKGTVIQAVLETALDSNRPGFARAIVSRDVMGFDGSRILIPRGSRILGEYKSDVVLGQNRVLIQWQRLTRPDGVIINMDSPSADPLGRAGVKGNVNTHFFQRFSGAILQSALDIGTQLATREVSRNSIYVGIPGLGQAVAPTPDKIQPTVTVRQGRSVSVFVARDLDFTKVGS